jgi:hypothetical protein
VLDAVGKFLLSNASSANESELEITSPRITPGGIMWNYSIEERVWIYGTSQAVYEAVDEDSSRTHSKPHTSTRALSAFMLAVNPGASIIL